MIYILFFQVIDKYLEYVVVMRRNAHVAVQLGMINQFQAKRYKTNLFFQLNLIKNIELISSKHVPSWLLGII